jgi:hypothetical protein
VLGYVLDDRGFDSRQGLEIFLFTTVSRPALGPTQPLIQWVQGALSLRVKRLEREADHSPQSSAEVKECVELYFHSPNPPSGRGAQLKHRDNFTFSFTIRMQDRCHTTDSVSSTSYNFTYHFMEQSPSWEPNSYSASQKIQRFLLNSNVHYRFHNSPPFVRILSQMIPVHNLLSCFPNIHSNIILPHKPTFSNW